MFWPYFSPQLCASISRAIEAHENIQRAVQSSKMIKPETESSMTQYEEWTAFNHRSTPIPDGKVQVWLDGEYRSCAEKRPPRESKTINWTKDNSYPIIAFRRVKEPVRGMWELWPYRGEWRSFDSSSDCKMTLPTENNKPIPDTYIGRNTGAEIKIEEVG